MGAIASQIISLTIAYSTVYPGTDQRKHQSSASLAVVWEIPGEFPAQRASNAEKFSIWWRHHVLRFSIGLAIRTARALWRHAMETLSALPALCEGKPLVTGVFPGKGPVTQTLIFSLMQA